MTIKVAFRYKGEKDESGKQITHLAIVETNNIQQAIATVKNELSTPWNPVERAFAVLDGKKNVPVDFSLPPQVA